MPTKTSAVDELSALKARNDSGNNRPGGVAPNDGYGTGVMLPRAAWIGFALILALTSAISLTLAYRELRGLSERERGLALKEQQLEEYDQRISVLRVDLGKHEARSDQLKGEIALLQSDAAKGAEAAAAYKMHSAMLPNLKTEVEGLGSRLEGLKDERATLDSAVAKAKAELDALEDRRRSEESEAARIAETLGERRAMLDDLNTTIASNRVTAAFYTRAIEEAMARNAELREESREERSRRDKAIQEHNTVSGELASLEESVTRLRSERAVATNEIALLVVEMDRLATRIREERTILGSLEADKTKLTEAIAQMASVKANYEALAQKKTEIERQLTTLDNQAASRSSEVAELNAKADELKRQVAALETRRLDLERIVNQLIGRQRALEAHAETNASN